MGLIPLDICDRRHTLDSPIGIAIRSSPHSSNVPVRFPHRLSLEKTNGLHSRSLKSVTYRTIGCIKTHKPQLSIMLSHIDFYFGGPGFNTCKGFLKFSRQVHSHAS